MKSSLAALLFAGLMFAASPDADAASFNGKFDIAQTDTFGSTTTARYYSAAAQLSIYAPEGANAELLREAFFRKTFVSVSYTPIACPPGTGGSCGALTFITVSAGNIP